MLDIMLDGFTLLRMFHAHNTLYLHIICLLV